LAVPTLPSPPGLVFYSVISLMELKMGVLRMERRDVAQGRILQAWLLNDVRPSMGESLLLVTEPIALRCAALPVPNPRPERDALLAATALVHGPTLATRNTADFKASDVTRLNPFM
jgi:predicted nucleic acid-binding protein